jgi:hypothetical protein
MKPNSHIFHNCSLFWLRSAFCTAMSGYTKFEGKWLVLPAAFWNTALGNWAEDLYGDEWKTKFTTVRIKKWCKAAQRYGQRLKFEWEEEGAFHLQLWHVDECQEQGRFFGMSYDVC